MPRTLNANALSNINGSTVYPIFLVALNFDAPVYAHSDYGTISHTPPYLSSPVNYLGVGTLGSVSAIQEDPKIAAKFVLLIGIKISKKKRIGLHPSIRAASTISSGIVIKNCLNKKVAVAEAINGKINPE